MGMEIGTAKGFDMSVLADVEQAGCKYLPASEGEGAMVEAVEAPRGDATLYKISDGVCGQSTLDARYAKYAEEFAGLKEGTCASQGYTVADGSQTLKVPVIGTVSVEKFKQA